MDYKTTNLTTNLDSGFLRGVFYTYMYMICTDYDI